MGVASPVKSDNCKGKAYLSDKFLQSIVRTTMYFVIAIVAVNVVLDDWAYA